MSPSVIVSDADVPQDEVRGAVEEHWDKYVKGVMELPADSLRDALALLDVEVYFPDDVERESIVQLVSGELQQIERRLVFIRAALAQLSK